MASTPRHPGVQSCTFTSPIITLPRPHLRRSIHLSHFATQSSAAGDFVTAATSATVVAPTPDLAAVDAADVYTDDETIVTTFRWPAQLGRPDSVAVVGCFSNWTPLPLTCVPGTGDWVRSLALPPGPIQFKYVINGDDYQASPCEPTVEDHMSGHFNNTRLIAPTCVLTWPTVELGGASVMVAGDWSSWGELIPMKFDAFSGNHIVKCCLPPQTYSVQFLVDNEWRLRPDADAAHTPDGHFGNVVRVAAPPAFRIFYRTGWPSAVLRVRRINNTSSSSSSDNDNTNTTTGSSTTTGEWETVRLHDTAARTSADAGQARWKTATILADSPDQALEFIPASAEDPTNEDRPNTGGTAHSYYLCPRPGGYKLRHGEVRPFYNANHGPTMLVSDLDGTLVGDGAEADTYTSEFGNYWENTAALVGSVLVFNTGRSIGQFQGLLEEKCGALPVPDAVITAVGTKVWLLNREGGTRGTASGTLWKEDEQWSRMLDEYWDLEVARAAATAAIAAAPQETAYWLDDGREHEHRVALSVRADAVPAVSAAMESVMTAAGLKYKIVVSGAGEWRYVDMLSAGAGKLAALEYVRTLFGIPKQRCMAAGDSGNDVLMLAGDNPAVVVGNAQPELLQWVSTQPQDGRLVLADAAMARGVLEGLARHGLY